MRLFMIFFLLMTIAGCSIFKKKKCDCPDLRKKKRIALQSGILEEHKHMKHVKIAFKAA
jgi:hypothetical protein